ncbi:hypothetical protein TRP8649_02107 [Pelagimonas phthalicica]|uniref:Uncharacterized protein n=1 Tax=Pelagimonas phthalicica TaxID=1037362 RepID=A0A238JC54_9RHOB|nr:hypothetical protein [Pelagimonas phthalicica]TDS90948.1 hypothetical protein CLV87_2109 [Pelagimonas phthalicica]SMX27995.1 hypothetical protein TRP8649_02107 [Pelagimonas phthalicica]
MSSRQQAQWQSAWHDILDEFPEQVATPRPAVLPAIKEDFRLHFDFWALPIEAQKNALSLLPNGAALGQRAEAWQRLKSPTSPNEAKVLLQQGLAQLQHQGYSCPHPNSPVSFCAAQSPVLMQSDPVTFDLDDALFDMLRECPPRTAEAFHFLSETYYRAANCYEVANWLVWPLITEPSAPDLYLPFARLAAGGWFAVTTTGSDLLLSQPSP